jgi:hypothetical protein
MQSSLKSIRFRQKNAIPRGLVFSPLAWPCPPALINAVDGSQSCSSGGVCGGIGGEDRWFPVREEVTARQLDSRIFPLGSPRMAETSSPTLLRANKFWPRVDLRSQRGADYTPTLLARRLPAATIK